MNKLNEINYQYGVTSKQSVKDYFNFVCDEYSTKLFNKFCDFISFVDTDGKDKLRGVFYLLDIGQDYFYRLFLRKCLATRCTNVHITQMIGCVNFFVRRYNAIIDFIENGNPDMEFEELKKFLGDRGAYRFEGTLSHYSL